VFLLIPFFTKYMNIPHIDCVAFFVWHYEDLLWKLHRGLALCAMGSAF